MNKNQTIVEKPTTKIKKLELKFKPRSRGPGGAADYNGSHDLNIANNFRSKKGKIR